MERTPVTSSNVVSVGYDEAAQTLEVEFKGKDGKPGPVYRYSGVKVQAYLGLMKAESVGSHLHRYIKPNYAVKRVELEPEQADDSRETEQ